MPTGIEIRQVGRMAVKKGIVGALVAMGAAMLFLVSAAGAMYGGYDVDDGAAVGNAADDAAGDGGLGEIVSPEPAVSADIMLDGYVLDNATGGGIAGALVVVINIPEDMTREQARKYVDKIIERLRLAREIIEDRRQKLEKAEDCARQKLEQARERLDSAGERLEEKKERLQDALENAKDRPGGAGRPEMKRIEKAQLKIADQERKLEQAQEKLGGAQARMEDRMGKLREKIGVDVDAIREKLSARGIFIVKTDETGHFETKAATGLNVIVAVAPGYAQGRLGVELPRAGEKPVTLRLDAKPQPEVYRIRFVWGYLDGLNPEGEFAAWNGSISVSEGAMKLLRTVQFEHGGRFINGGNDKVYPQKERDTLSWRSSTTGARDGVVVLVVVPAGTENAEITLTAGDWSKTVPLARLEGQKVRVPVGDAGHEIFVACELLDRPAM